MTAADAPPPPRRVRRQAVIEYKGARQQAIWGNGETIPPAQDQATGFPLTQPRRTAGGQERCDIDKGLRQRREVPPRLVTGARISTMPLMPRARRHLHDSRGQPETPRS